MLVDASVKLEELRHGHLLLVCISGCISDRPYYVSEPNKYETGQQLPFFFT